MKGVSHALSALAPHLPYAATLTIVRVLHGARDAAAIFGEGE
jgi:hypothetical protein